MNTHVAVNTYTYSVTYLSDKIVHSLKEIIREIGLDPAKLAGDWESTQNGISTWLQSRHLKSVHLEVFSITSDKLILRWDLGVVYDAPAGDGSMWVDTDDLCYAVKKAGHSTASCDYRILVSTQNGRPDVAGWSKCSSRSTAHLSRHSVGTMIGAGNGLASTAAYWSAQQ